MDTISFLLIAVIILNIIFGIINQNLAAAAGWFVAGLEWLRNLLT